MYEATGDTPVQITRDSTIQNIMLGYSQLSLQDWLAHPDCRRYLNVAFPPSLSPTNELESGPGPNVLAIEDRV